MNLLDVGYAVAGVLLAPFWARKARSGWGERFGKIGALPAKDGSRVRVMLHAVSVGEVNALRTLAPLLAERAEVIITTTTDTGMARAQSLFAESCHVRRYPLDFSRSVARFLDRAQPDVVGLVELEVWPNFVKACRRRGIPVAVVNGRLSARSFKGYMRFRRFLRPLFSSLTRVAAQDEAYAERFASMGTPRDRIEVLDSMKWDAAPVSGSTDETSERLAAELGIDRSRPLIVAGSTGPLAGDGLPEGEEALLDGACPDGVQLLCAPRKPERFDEAFEQMGGSARCARRSAGTPAPAGTNRFLLDTIGELRAAYALADVVVVGRSFGGLHGSDPIEPAALARAIVIGSHVSDFETAVATLRQEEGLVQVGPGELGPKLAELMGDDAARARLGSAASTCVDRHRGGSRACADLLLSLQQA